MKIIQIVTQMESGGAQKVASLLTEALRDRDHDAHLWFLYKKSSAYEESDHVRVLFPQRPAALGFAQLGRQLWKELRQAQPDAVITHTHSSNFFAAPVAAAAGVPIRVAVHHNPIDTYSPLMRIADRIVFAAGGYSSMVTVSGGVTQSFSSHNPVYQRHLHRIYNAIGSCAVLDPIDVRSHYNIPSGMKLLVNVGRMAPQKNQSLLLHMLQRISDAYLILVGDGDLRQTLAHEASILGVADRVRFAGELRTPQVNAILHAADAFLLPSCYESFCLAAVEAMQCGTPVIASDLVCLREVLGDRQLFFPMNNLGTLVRRVKYLLSHPELAAEMRVAGQARAEQFSITRMAGEYECLLNEAAVYARKQSSATNNLRRINPLGSIARINH